MKGRVLLLIGILTPNGVSAFTSVISSSKRTVIDSIALQRRLDNDNRSSRCTTSLSAMALPSLSAATASISGFYKAFPLLAGFLTCSTKASIADSMAQYSSREEDTKFCFKRNFKMVIYSGVVLGMLCEIMYNSIFPSSEYLKSVQTCAHLCLYHDSIQSSVLLTSYVSFNTR